MKKGAAYREALAKPEHARLARLSFEKSRLTSQSTRRGRTALIPTNVGAVEDERLFVLGAQSQESVEGTSIHFAIAE